MLRNKFIILLILLILTGALVDYYQYRQKAKSDDITLFGNVDVRQVDLSFRVSGLVKEIYFEEGDLVPTGSLVGILDQQPYLDQVRQAEAEVESIKASLVNADILFNPAGLFIN